MIIIGDSLIENLKDFLECEIFSYRGISLERYLSNLSSLHENNYNIIIYCFGLNDINNGISISEVIKNYNKLKRGNIKTYIILPPFQKDTFIEEIDRLLDIDLLILESFTDDYYTYDGLHPNIQTVNKLANDIKSI